MLGFGSSTQHTLLEPPIFELTKASEKSDEDVQISLNEQEKKVVESS